jgi:hypothetical protein
LLHVAARLRGLEAATQDKRYPDLP